MSQNFGSATPRKMSFGKTRFGAIIVSRIPLVYTLRIPGRIGAVECKGNFVLTSHPSAFRAEYWNIIYVHIIAIIQICLG